MSSTQKRRRAKLRAGQGFDADPPRCFTCIHHSKPVEGIPGKQQYLAAFCKLGNFGAHSWAICDHWTNNEGDVLE